MTVYSHSRVETFNVCPFKYKLSYIEELDTLPNNDDPTNALIIGSAMHMGIEQGLDKAIEQYKSEFNILSDEHYNEIIKFEKLLPKVERFINRNSCEFELKLETDDFKGFIDYIEYRDNNEVAIYDFKYSNNIDRYLESDQLHLYKYFYEQLNPFKTVTELGFIFIPKINIRQKKTETIAQFRKRLLNELENKDVQLVKVEYNANCVINFFKNIKIVLETTDFEKKPSNFCRFCNFRNYCENGQTWELVKKITK